jgi:ParB-like chromosome segregation protein Spo0J
MKHHEYANIYRLLNDSEIQKMAESIKEQGQILPIVTYEGLILDGRNRYKACLIAGVKPRFEEYTGDDPLGRIAALNDHRRHDNPTELALVGERMASLKRGGTGANQYKSAESPSEPSAPVITLQRAAELAGTSKAQIKRVRKAKKDGIPELVDMLESSEITPADADVVSSLPEEEQKKAVAGGITGVKQAAKRIRKSKVSVIPRTPPAEIPEESTVPEAGVALTYARTALNALNQIPKRDPSRKQAIALISEWVENNKTK